MNKTRVFAVILVILILILGYFVHASEFSPNSVFSRFPFKLGLDLNGGTELTYRANVDEVPSGQIDDSMDTLRDVIERRVNIFGVSEPIIQAEKASALAGKDEYRLIVELPGVTDVQKAIDLIGDTPLLEFKLLTPEGEALLSSSDQENLSTSSIASAFTQTELTGRYLDQAQVEFSPTTREAFVSLTFDSTGTEIFADITSKHRGEILAIFLDGQPISLPVIQTEIRDGKAQITGNFTPEEAKVLVRNLNYGALPVPIELIGTQTIGATLGNDALVAGVKAGILGFILVVAFLIFWYRLPGFVASIALIMYILISLVLFKLIPVTLTAAGLAGFILSIGMAVDANILIFERMREERARGKDLITAIHEGFRRAWLSIRDSNISSIITAIVLFWLGTSAVKGFALTFGLGVLVSMFTAITASRTFLFAIGVIKDNAVTRFLYGSGIGIHISK